MQDKSYMKLINTFQEENQKLVLSYLSQYGSNLSIGTKANHLIVLKSLAEFTHQQFQAVSKEDLVLWVDSLQGRAGGTLARYKSVVKTFYRWLEGSEDYPERVKWIKTQRSKKKLPRNVPCGADIKRLISAAINLRDKAMIFTIYDSGCRISEILGLKVGDITFDKYGAFFIVDGKTGQRRIRLIDAVPDLQAWMNKHPRKDDSKAPLWPSIHDPKIPLIYNAAFMMFQRLAKRAGLPKINPHLLRHCRLTQLAKEFSESELKILAGWTGDSRMAGVYIHLSGEDVERKMLENRGMLQPEDKIEMNIMTPRPCPRKCSEIQDGNEHVIIYSATDKFCMKCGMALDLKTAMELEDSQKNIDKSLASMLDSKIDELIEKRANEILDQKIKALAGKV
ncbi:MAG TPA: tyrosine-type recombinase/integrase [Candidatus Methanoperedens sp.]